MKTKAKQIREFVQSHDYKRALALANYFKRDFDKTQQRVIQIAHDVVTGHDRFYQQLGIDTQQMYDDAVELLNQRYLIV